MNKLEAFYSSALVTVVILFLFSIVLKNDILFTYSMTSAFWICLTYATFDFTTRKVEV